LISIAIGITRSSTWRTLVLLIFMIIGAACLGFGQDKSGHPHASVFGGVGWATVPSSSGFFGGMSAREDHAAVTAGAEIIPFSHIGFALNVTHMQRLTEVFNGTSFVQGTGGDTIVSGDAVFHLLIRKVVSPFIVLGLARENGAGSAMPVLGANAALGANIRVSPHVA
jgi:hypothetical protein